MENRDSRAGAILKDRIAVILSRPENPENLGLVARNMKNTGFDNLRIVGASREEKAFVTAVHAKDILENARIYANVADAVADLDVIFAATAKARKNFSRIRLEDALDKISDFPRETRFGLLFGNERTGLTSEELLHSNFRFKIPQAGDQPSYNLASAVLVTLFCLFYRKGSDSEIFSQPLSRKEQEICIQRILLNIEKKGFSHKTNKKQVEEKVSDLLGRLTITSEDRNLLLALFSKGIR